MRLCYVDLMAVVSPGIVVIVTVLWIMVPQLAYNKGVEVQKEFIEKYELKGCYIEEDGWNNCTQVIDENGTKVYEGLLIAMSINKIALYKNNGSQLLTLKPSQKLFRERAIDSNTTK